MRNFFYRRIINLFKFKRRTWIIIVIILLFAFFAYKSFIANKISVKTTRVKYGDITPTVNVAGEIKGNIVTLSSKIIGNIEWIGVSEGDYVKTGQLLARLDSYDNSKSDYERTKSLFQNGFASKQQLEASKMQFEGSYFSSPMNGIVVNVANKVGEAVAPGMGIFTIIEPKSAYAEVQIDEADIEDVKIGQIVKIYSDAYPNDIFYGQMASIGQAAELKKIEGRIKPDEEDKVFRSKVLFTDPSYKLKIGMTISADIVLETKPNVVTVSREVVFSKDDKQAVFIVKNKKAKETILDIGLKDASNVEVLSGVKISDEVITNNLDKLKDGSKVIVDNNDKPKK